MAQRAAECQGEGICADEHGDAVNVSIRGHILLFYSAAQRSRKKSRRNEIPTLKRVQFGGDLVLHNRL